MAYKVKSGPKRRLLPKGFGPFLAYAAAVVVPAVVAIMLPKPKDRPDWVLIVCGAMLAAGAVAAAAARGVRAILGKRGRSPRAAGVFTVIYRVCFVMAIAGVAAAFFRMGFGR